MSFVRRLTVSSVLFLVACGSSSDDGANPGGASQTGGAPSQGGSSGSSNAGASGGGSTNGGGSNGGSANGGSGNGGGASGGSGPSSGGSGNSPDGGTGGSTSPDGGGTGGGGSDVPGSCCVASNAKGCTDKTIQDCVCNQDPRCCSEKWNDVCVGLVSGLGCGTACATNDCCTESTAPGCTTKTVQDCVCGKSAECCSTAWDGFCVQLVTQNVLGGVCGTCSP